MVTDGEAKELGLDGTEASFSLTRALAKEG
jgi:hypothetical protein